MAELFTHVMKTIDKMEQMTHRAEPVTPAAIAQGVRQVYKDQGLPLDETQLQAALPQVMAIAPERVPAPISPSPGATKGLPFVEIVMALGMIVGLSAMIFSLSARAHRLLDVQEVQMAVAQLSTALQENPDVTPAQWAVANPDWMKTIQTLGSLSIQPAPNTEFSLSHVNADRCDLTRLALVKNMDLMNNPTPSMRIRINGVTATDPAGGLALSCGADNQISVEENLVQSGNPP